MTTLYLQDIPLDEAKQVLRDELEKLGQWSVLGVDEIPLDEHAAGRILVEPVVAVRSSPHYHASAMDGFAVRSFDTQGAQPSKPVTLSCTDQALYLDTGDALPEWADAVIPIENIEPLDDRGEVMKSGEVRKPSSIRIRGASAPWSHVRPMGEDIVTSQLILPSGISLRPVDLGAAAAGGISLLRVAKKPVVTILPTGTELVEIGKAAGRGEITEFNSMVLAAQVNQWGGLAKRKPITVDNFEQICDHIQNAVDESDLVLVNAGSSAGSEDFTSAAVARLGRLLVHGVAVRPGHPVIIGFVPRRRKGAEARQVPVIGVPGYPVSAALTNEIFVEPLIHVWLGEPEPAQVNIQAKLTRKINSPAGDDDYVRVVVGAVGDQMLAAPLNRGAGVITSLSKADGIVIIPRHTQGLEAGDPVEVHLYRPENELRQTIFTIGSHDMTLDVLTQALNSRQRRLVSANAGSLGGLIALGRGQAHFAGSHLLDTLTGEYNISYIQKYLRGVPVRLFDWVERIQGLVVRKGNPKQIHGIEDLWRSDVVYINRQKGSGTRVLLDDAISRQGKTCTGIQGYEREEYTHLGVAAAVSSGRADCGLAIHAAANALDLDFLPLFSERYQLVIPARFADSELLKPLFDLMADAGFRRQVSSMPGYKADRMGEENLIPADKHV